MKECLRGTIRYLGSWEHFVKKKQNLVLTRQQLFVKTRTCMVDVTVQLKSISNPIVKRHVATASYSMITLKQKKIVDQNWVI